MKKICLIGLGLFAALSVSAQSDVVKDVQNQLKGGNIDYKAALKNIKPALSNPETKRTALPWFLAGKAGFGVFDEAFLQESIGNSVSPEAKKEAGNGLIDGYKYYMTALQLDSLPDEKGKVKPKYSKDIVKALNGSYVQLKNAGVFLFEVQDFMGAYNAWELYATLPQNPLLGRNAPQAEADSIVGQIMYYQALAALSANQDRMALNKMREVIDKGYQTLDVYRYGVEAARRLNDSIALVDLAQKGYEKFGTEDISFIGQLINSKLDGNDLASCYTLVNEAIAGTPDENVDIKSQLYDIIGFICERDNKNEDAKNAFNKAIALNPNYGKAYYDLARVIYNEAVKVDEETTDEAARQQLVNPKLVEAAELFEKAYALDEDNLSSVPGILYRLYYRLGPGYEEKAQYWENL